MDKSLEESYIEFVEKYPECFAIVNSDLMLGFLRFLVASPKSFSDFQLNSVNVEAKDIRLILLAFESAGLAKKTPGESDVYYATQKARKLLKKYDETKKHFGDL